MRNLTLVTGANGFIGSELTKELAQCKKRVVAGIRNNHDQITLNDTEMVQISRVGDLSLNLDLGDLLSKIDTVVHCAARAHVMYDRSADLLPIYRKHNTRATINLAQQAADAGVRRFIFISSIKVNGDSTIFGQSFTEDDKVNVVDPYSISKFEAETALLDLAKKANMDVVIIRPPLVYGKGAKGNFSNLIKLIKSGLPIPLSLISNKRSIIGIENLIDLIIRCIDHPLASNQIFLASDGRDVSVPELITFISKAMGVRPISLPMPLFIIKIVFAILGKKDSTNRLLDSLQVDISKSKELLNWEPKVSLELGLEHCFMPEKQK